MRDNVKNVMDWAALGATVGTIAGWLPAIAALMSIIWYLVRFYDRWKGNRASY